MTNKPLISVVIPAYNRSAVIGCALKSVLDQSFQDFEVLVVDDGSSDNLREVIDKIGDCRIRIIRQANGGANKARNTGIDAAQGKFVALLDSDDNFLPDHLESAVAQLKINPNVIVFAPVIVDRGGGKTFIKPPRGPKKLEPISEYLLSSRGFIQTSTVVLSTKLAKKVRYSEGLRFGQDKDFAIRLASAGCEFLMREHPGAIWSDVRDPNRISAAYSSKARMDWLDFIRPQLTTKAYYADRGWVVAKGLFSEGKSLQAIKYYLRALTMGCYGPRLSAVIFLQIFFSGRTYRKLADTYVIISNKLKKGREGK
ncbi:glycosyltransferase family 2 protein [Hydrocarboniphaga effusa]|uniref:glycosyltransferase family 2 protein n=1 Tax=Hydrocarboniphaga effusa TaxID=243629 RepID=UPI00398BFD6A